MSGKGAKPDPPAGERQNPPANPPKLSCLMSTCGCCEKVVVQRDALEQAQKLEREAFGAGLLAATNHFISAFKNANEIDPQQAWIDYRGESAGDTGHVHDWSDVDAFGWRRCRDTECNAGMPPSLPKTVEN